MKKSIIAFVSSVLIAGSSSAFASPSCCPSGADSAERTTPAQLVMTSYDHVSKALAGDKLDDARNAARTLSVIGAMGGKDEVADHARAMVRAEDLAEARGQFKKVSASVLPLAGENGEYRIFACPAAGEGGFWLQTGETPRNPYFGAERLECGRLTTAEELASLGNGAPGRVDGATVTTASLDNGNGAGGHCETKSACCEKKDGCGEKKKECSDEAKAACAEKKKECGEARQDCESKAEVTI